MGPRSHERGNVSQARYHTDRTARLQWGRVLMNAETKIINYEGYRARGASMGPRSHERGNTQTFGYPGPS